MAEYNISQKPKKPSAPGIRNFWIPKLQAKKLNQKTVIIALSIAGAVIIAGLVFAAIKISSPNTPTKPTGSSTRNQTTRPKVNISTAEHEAIQNAVTSKNASLLNKYYASKVKIVIVDLGINQTADGAQAAALINDGLNTAQNPWNFNEPSGELASWQNGPYGQYFSGNVTVGTSANGDVISIGFNVNGQIDSVFIAPSSVLVNPTPNPGPGSATGSSTGSAPGAPTSANAHD